MTRSGLPVRRYAAAIGVAAAGFLALSMVDQRDVFLSAWGLAPGPAVVKSGEGAPAEHAVRGFLGALEAAYGAGDAASLGTISISEPLREEVASELAHPLTRAASAGLVLSRLEVLRVEPRPPAGGEVATDETWTSPTGRRSRLRFRYRLATDGEGLRVNEMTPLLPEPVSEPRR